MKMMCVKLRPLDRLSNQTIQPIALLVDNRKHLLSRVFILDHSRLQAGNRRFDCRQWSTKFVRHGVDEGRPEPFAFLRGLSSRQALRCDASFDRDRNQAAERVNRLPRRKVACNTDGPHWLKPQK